MELTAKDLAKWPIGSPSVRRPNLQVCLGLPSLPDLPTEDSKRAWLTAATYRCIAERQGACRASLFLHDPPHHIPPINAHSRFSHSCLENPTNPSAKLAERASLSGGLRSKSGSAATTYRCIAERQGTLRASLFSLTHRTTSHPTRPTPLHHSRFYALVAFFHSQGRTSAGSAI